MYNSTSTCTCAYNIYACVSGYQCTCTCTCKVASGAIEGL